jgi:MFS family permease
MSTNVLVILAGWLIALAIFFGFIVLLRYLQHRENMAMISSGMRPNTNVMNRQRRSRGMLRAGLIIALVGFALTIGLYPIGFISTPLFAQFPWHLGPWLLPGLIPLGVGVALITSYYLERDTLPVDTDNKLPDPKVKEATEEDTLE